MLQQRERMSSYDVSIRSPDTRTPRRPDRARRTSDRSVCVGEDLQVIFIADLLVRIDINPDRHAIPHLHKHFSHVGQTQPA